MNTPMHNVKTRLVFGVKEKIMSLVMLVVLLAILSTVGPSMYLQNEKLFKSYQDKADIGTIALSEYVNEDSKKTALVAEMAALIPGLTENIEARNTPNLVNLLTPIGKTGEVDFITVTDHQGIVIARTHASNTGDSITNIYAVRQALNGQTASTLESSPATPLSIRTCVPVKNNAGLVVGTLSISKDGARSELVDKTKQRYDVEATIFSKDTRIATTVMKDGQRIIGTKGNTDVVETVLKSKSTFAGLTDVNGIPYIANYKPILNPQGEVMGMLFAGKSLAPYYAERNQQIFFTAAAALIILVICLLIAYSLSRSICRPLQRMTAIVATVAAGDLSKQVFVDSQDEFGQLANSFNVMLAELKNLVGTVARQSQTLAASSEELTASAEQSTTTSHQVATSMNKVAQGAELQLLSIKETVSVIESMAMDIQQIAQGSELVTEKSARSTDMAIVGGHAATEAVHQMTAIAKTVNESASMVTDLGQRSQEIGQIVDTIAGIAAQTNLLALNAAIEAARAGEQGRGFAVVAEEVRKLAEQSHSATKKIAKLIGEIQAETNKAVLAMKKGTQEVALGTDVVNAAGKTFSNIKEMVLDVNKQMCDISVAISALKQNSHTIVQSVDSINILSKKSAEEAEMVSAATEQQAASINEITLSSHDLAKMAQDLQEAVTGFTI